MRKTKNNKQIIESELILLRDYTQARIDNGDLDFDDWIYRSRDAAQTLLDVFFEQEKKNEQ